MSRVDAGYVAYLTRENAWLRARVAELVGQREDLQAALEDLGLEVETLRAVVLEYRQRGEDPATDPPEEVLPWPRTVDGT